MSQRRDEAEWFMTAVLAAAAALLSLTLFFGSTAAGIVHRAVARHGTSSHTLQALLTLTVLACLGGAYVGVGLRAWTVGTLVIITALTLLVLGCWLLDTTRTRAAARRLEQEDLSAILGSGSSWWEEES